MSKKEFLELLSEEIRERLGSRVVVDLHRVRKNNGIELEGMTILQPGQNITPAIYLDPFYEKFCRGESIASIAEQILVLHAEFSVEPLGNPEEAVSYTAVKANLRYKLINYEMNRELLYTVPHEKILDLAKVYYYKIAIPEVEHTTVMVHKSDLLRWGVTRRELAEMAAQNMKEKERPEIAVMRGSAENSKTSDACGLSKTSDACGLSKKLNASGPSKTSDACGLLKTFNTSGPSKTLDASGTSKKSDISVATKVRAASGHPQTPGKTASNNTWEMPEHPKVWKIPGHPKTREEQEAPETNELPLLILTNKSHLFGAACMLYDGVLRHVAERFQSDLYVLPSSVHEVLLRPVEEKLTPGLLRALVRRVNRTSVPPFEVLSDNIYRYRRTLGKLMLEP